MSPSWMQMDLRRLWLSCLLLLSKRSFALRDLTIDVGLHATYNAKVTCFGTNQIGDVLFNRPADLLVNGDTMSYI
ncbi:hypothetical protein EON65_29745 [archaeon]|nr:MAG: hypothetical protein EON65_29745 [archaeon]